jgi:hypothetical protein
MKNYIKITILSIILMGGILLVFSTANACEQGGNVGCNPPIPEPRPEPRPKPQHQPIRIERFIAQADKSTNTNNVVVSNTNTNTQSQSIEVKVKVKKEKNNKKSKNEKKKSSKKTTATTKKLPRTGSSTAGFAGLGLVSCVSALGIKRYFWKLA